MRIHPAAIPVALTLVLVAGCGKNSDKASTTASDSQIPDGTFKGHFAKVSIAPKGTGKIGGTAEMVLSAAGTQVTIAATGLDPKAVYVAHVHNAACSAPDPGGAHFKYTPTGGDEPPNEIHLAITVNAKGKGTAQTTNPVKAGPDAKSVVIHVKRPAGAKADEVKPPKVACADLAAS
jgi:Cu-Zn family superoxide dismutase